jgi:16S rRNA (cytosine1407-C5)-methyltransferase
MGASKQETGFLDALNPEDVAQLAQALRRPPPPALRVNTLKIAANEARRLWSARYGWQVRAVPFCATGWQVTEHAQDLSQTLEYKMGFYYIQDAASMLPVELFHREQTTPLVLDMAASPGGKTTHLTCKLQDRGLVIANDSSAGRMTALRSNLQHWGATCTVVSNYPGERFGRWFPEAFDQVLLDAPCSGESLRTAERRKSRPVSDKRRKALQRQQMRLLSSAFEALKPGGQLVYATCSLHPDENEAVLEALLSAYPAQATLEAPARLLPVPAPALASYQGHAYPPQVRRAVRLWPQIYDTSGFFAALVRKQGAIPVQRAARPQRALREAGFQVLKQHERAAISKHLQDFGFDLETVLERQALMLLRRAALVYAVPELFLSRFGDWPCMSMGLLAGEGSGRDFVPSHELVTRFGAQFVGRRLRIEGEQVRTWLAGRDLRGLACAHPLRAVVLLEDEHGRFLGRGKVLDKRIRNLLPKRLIY